MAVEAHEIEARHERRAKLTVVDGPKFSALPHAVLFDRGLSRDAVVLYAVLQAHWWQGGECWASHATLADEMRVKPRMLRYYLTELLDRGHITERLRGHGQAKAYAQSQAATDCQLERQEIAGSEPKRQEIAGQAATDYRFKRQEIATRRRRIEEDSPKEEDTGVVVAADAAPEPAKAKPPKEKTRATLAPETLELTPKHLDYARTLGLDAAAARRETDKFLAHHRFKGTRGVDWYAGWQNWMRRAIQYGAQPAAATPAHERQPSKLPAKNVRTY
jgi:hypothetical protein